jgi:conjugal transfer/entry exclusion protein
MMPKKVSGSQAQLILTVLRQLEQIDGQLDEFKQEICPPISDNFNLSQNAF